MYARSIDTDKGPGPLLRSEQTTSSQRGPAGGAKGTAYYFETFTSDLGDWSSVTLAGNVNWKWTDVGPGPTASFYPVPPLATTAGWVIIDDDHDGMAGNVVHAHLISPVIDLSGAPAYLQLEFDQYFQEFQFDSTIVGISTDGGLEWQEMEINNGVGRDGRPNPEHIAINITDWIGGDPSNVQIRFRYRSEWDYGWQIDNVAIREMPEHELAILQGGISHSHDGTEFGFIPLSELPGELQVVAELFNAGSQTMHDVEILVELKDEDGQVVAEETFNVPEITSWDTVLVDMLMTVDDLVNGVYTAYFTASSMELDADPENNVAQRTFLINEDFYGLDGIGIYAADELVTTAIGTNSFEDAEDQLHLMNYFPVINGLTVYGIQFRIDPSSEAGAYVYAGIHDSVAVMNDQLDASYAETDFYDITEDDIANGVVNLFFQQPVMLNAGAYYADLVLHSTFGNSHIRVVDDITVPQPSLAAVIHIQDDQTYTNGNAYSIRLILDPEAVGMLETANTDGPQLFPNPGNGSVQLFLPNAGPHQVEVIDASGSIVLHDRITNGSLLDLSHCAPGVYLVRLTNEQGSSTIKYVKEL